MKQRGEKFCLSIIAIVGAFALAAQFYAAIDSRIVPLGETLLRFFSYFTIESNILVTLAVAAIWLNPQSAWGKFFSRPATLTALTVYIIVVGAVYNLVLRHLYHLIGISRMANELLHVALPVLFVIYWAAYVPKATLKWNIFPWLIFPIIYAVYTLIRGALVNYYPYPFMDAGKYGYERVMINIAVLILVFVGLSFLLVAIGKVTRKKAV